MRQAGFEPTTFGSGGAHFERRSARIVVAFAGYGERSLPGAFGRLLAPSLSSLLKLGGGDGLITGEQRLGIFPPARAALVSGAWDEWARD